MASPERLRHNLAAIHIEGLAFSIMVGVGESYLPAFVLTRGMGPLVAALVATLPILLGSLIQLLSPTLLAKIGSYRRFVIITAALQALAMLWLCLLTQLTELKPWMIFPPATLYWAGGLAAGPAWNAWVEQIVPTRLQPGFFARRGRLCQAGILAGLITGGLLLKIDTHWSKALDVFGMLFALGSLARWISTWMLARQCEALGQRSLEIQQAEIQQIGRHGMGNIWRLWREPGPTGRFITFILLMQGSVHLAGPYFTPYMIGYLKLDWLTYMFLLSLCFLGKMISLPWAGKLAARWGSERLMWVGSLGIVPISALWAVDDSVIFMACLQVLSGLVWGCYELGLLLQFFRQIPRERRIATLTLYNLGNSAAMVLGLMVGAWLLGQFGKTPEAFLWVFACSSACRAMVLLCMPHGKQAIRGSSDALHLWLSRTIAVRPMSGSMERPILSAMDWDCVDTKSTQDPKPHPIKAPG